MTEKPKKPTKPFTQRIPEEYVEALQEIALDHWLEETALLNVLYDHEDVFTDEKEFWKEVKYRNSALMSQLNHCKILAQLAAKAVHPGGKNTMEERHVAEDLIASVREKIKDKEVAWEKRRGDFLEKKFGNRGDSGSMLKANDRSRKS